MLIANPIYDVVFKYLMEDDKVAKIILSAIIGQEITHLVFKPQEFTQEIRTEKFRSEKNEGSPIQLTYYRLDFIATIATDEGNKLVIIEIQKAKTPFDLQRFRVYLGNQYANTEHIFETNLSGHPQKMGMPIISIYFIGHRLENSTAPAIKVNRTYLDLISGETISYKEPFIESLTHDCYIIQIPQLSQKRRNELEILLSVFDQSSQTDQSRHLLNVQESDFPTKFQPIIRRLQKAIATPQILKTMNAEDLIISELEFLERERLKALKRAELSEKALAEKEAEAPKALAEKEAEVQKALAEIEKLKRLLENQDKNNN